MTQKEIFDLQIPKTKTQEMFSRRMLSIKSKEAGNFYSTNTKGSFKCQNVVFFIKDVGVSRSKRFANTFLNPSENILQ